MDNISSSATLTKPFLVTLLEFSVFLSTDGLNTKAQNCYISTQDIFF